MQNVLPAYFLCVINLQILFSAEQETKAKLEKVAEIKKITSKMVAIKRYKRIVWLEVFHNPFNSIVDLFSPLTLAL